MNKTIKPLIFVTAAAAILILIYLWLDNSRIMHEFKDDDFRTAVEEMFPKASETDYKDVTILDVSARGITDISGIENFSKLKVLIINDNDISDITPLKNLKMLEILSAGGNDISDAEPLEYLSNLKELDLSCNRDLEDISFVRGLVELEKLNLRECSIINLSPLKNLRNLEYLNLHSNILIDTISPLYGLTGLKTLILRNVNIGDDIKYLENMVNLRRLNLRNTKVSDLTSVISIMEKGALQDDKQLEIISEVDIRDNPVENSLNIGLMDYWNNISLREPFSLNIVNPVDFSIPGGFYTKDFEISISSIYDRAVIYYTLDGSMPDPENTDSSKKYRIKDPATGEFFLKDTTTYIYDGPIRTTESMFDKKDISYIPTTNAEADENSKWQKPEDTVGSSIVLRAVAYVDGKRGSERTATYFSGEKPDMPVISIVTDPACLFDYYKGIYIPGEIYDTTDDFDGSWMQHPANYHTDIEYPSHLEFFDEDGLPGFSLNTGFRIHGGWSRSKALKNLRLYARSEYDILSRIDYDLFKTGSEGSYKRFILRSGFEDALWNTHANNRVNVDLLSQRPVLHYINGEYWGLVYISERFDRYYLENKYKVDPDEVTILEGPSAVLTEGNEAYEKEFGYILDFVRNNDMSLDENYNYVKSMTDISGFIDYNIVRIYSSCEDAVIKHVKVWKVPGEKWRWHTWDFDYALNNVDGYTIDVYGNDDENKHHDPKHTSLFTGLLKNEEFRNLFINRFCDLMNTLYLPDEFIKTLEAEAFKVEDQLNEHLKRWKQYSSFTYWENLLTKHRNFADLRPDIQRAQLIQYFGERNIDIGKSCEVDIEALDDKGSVVVNTLKERDMLKGIYYENIPIKVTAVPKEGFCFSHWQLNGKRYSENIDEIFYPENRSRIEAVFSVLAKSD